MYSAAGEVETDNELVIKAQNGCSVSFENLIVRHQRKMFGLCLRITRCPSEAEDSLRDAELLLFLKLKQFNFDSKYTSWCFRVTANCALQRLRKNKKQERVIDALLSVIAPIKPTTDLRWEQQEALRKAINSLNRKDRECFDARFCDGLCGDKLAERLGSTERNMRSRLFRVRRKLQAELIDWKQE